MLKIYFNTLRLFNRNTWLLLLTAALTSFGYIGIYVVLFNLYLLRLNFGPEFIGSINAVAQLGFALFSLPAGALGQRWGGRRMTIWGLGIAVAAFGLLSLAEFLPETWRASWLMVTYLLAWLAGALYLVNAYALFTASTEPAERSHAFSVRQALFPLGAFAGTLIGGLLPGVLAPWLGVAPEHPAAYSYTLFLGTGALLVGVFALAATRQVNSEQPQVRIESDGSNPVGLITFMAVISLLATAGYNMARTFAGVYLNESFHMSTASIGTLLSVSYLLAIPVSLLMPAIIARWGKAQTIKVGLLTLAFSLLPLVFIPSSTAAGLSLIGMSLASAFAAPALMLCQQEIVPPAWRPTISGAIVMAEGGGTALLAFGGGYLITVFGYHIFFLIGAILTIMGAGLLWMYAWVPRWMLMRGV